MTLQKWLHRIDSSDEVIEWVGNRTIQQLWPTCKKTDWMLWFAVQVMSDRRPAVLAACDCAELTLPLCNEDTINACVWALDVVRRACRSEATMQEVDAVRDAVEEAVLVYIEQPAHDAVWATLFACDSIATLKPVAAERAANSVLYSARALGAPVGDLAKIVRKHIPTVAIAFAAGVEQC